MVIMLCGMNSCQYKEKSMQLKLYTIGYSKLQLNKTAKYMGFSEKNAVV